MTANTNPEKCVLAYSGGLDTSAIVPWLIEQGYEVHAVLVDVGQAEDLQALTAKAMTMGATTAVVRDVRADMAAGVLATQIGLGATYEGNYRLGTALARPFIALAQVERAHEIGATALAHGATGKGNDQIRFEYAYRTLAPHCTIVAPWKTWEFQGRQDLVDYLESIGTPYAFEATKDLSMDENLWHLSVEGSHLEDPTATLDVGVFLDAVKDRFHPGGPENPGDATVSLTFEHGVPVALDGEPIALLDLVHTLNTQYRHADWAWDLVLENRFTGVKSRGLYINPAAKLLDVAIDALARATMNKHAYDQYVALGDQWAGLLYRGEYFTPQCQVVEQAATASTQSLNGTITVRLAPQLHVQAIDADGLFREELATFEASGYRHADANGFIALNWLQSTGRAEPWSPIETPGKESTHEHALEVRVAAASAVQ